MWICRILIIVFTFNILAPELLFAQQQTARVENLKQTIEQQVQAQREKPLSQAGSLEELDQLYAAQMTALVDIYEGISFNGSAKEDLQAYDSLTTVIRQMHSLAESYADEKEQLSNKPADVMWKGIQQKVASSVPADRSALQGLKKHEKKEVFESDLFLKELEHREFSLEELTELIDPLLPAQNRIKSIDSYATTAYAAEVIFNTLRMRPDLILSDPVEKETALMLMPQLQQRILYRLNHMPKNDTGDNAQYANAQYIKARGTLRTLLYQIHQFYKDLGLNDPLTTRYTERTTTYTEFTVRPTKEMYEKYVIHIKEQNKPNNFTSSMVENKLTFRNQEEPLSYEDFVQKYSKTLPYRPSSLPPGTELVENKISHSSSAAEQLQKDIFDQFMDQFTSELEQMKYFKKGNRKKKVKTDQAEFTYLQLQAEYAVRYAMIYGRPDLMYRWVDIFEKAPKENLIHPGHRSSVFNSDYNEILSTLFGTAAETLQLYKLPKETEQKTIQFFVDIAAPSHSVQTRVLGIGKAQLLHRPRKWKLPFREDPSDTRTFPLGDADRNRLARYAVDIYTPMQTAHYDSYGLDPEQMQVLSHELASYIDSLCPVVAPKTVWNEEFSRYEADPTQNIQLRQVATGSYLGKSGHSYPVPTFVYGTNGVAYPVVLDSQINKSRKDMADLRLGFDVVKEAALWVFAGALVTFTFKALVFTGGAVAGTVAALPRAAQAAKLASKGHKMHRFATKVGQGTKYTAKFANGLSPILARSGISIQTVRTEKVTVKAGELMKGTPTNAPQIAGKVGPKAGTIEAPVTRRGANYVWRGTDASGAAGWGKRVRNALSGKAPKAEKYIVNGVEFNAANFNYLRTAGDKARFLRRIASHEQLELGGVLPKLTREEQLFLRKQSQFGAAIDEALKIDAKASRVGQGTFDYWAYNGKNFEKISGKEFFERASLLKEQSAFTEAEMKIVKDLPDYYEILGVPRAATKEAIAHAYKSRAIALHPDKLAKQVRDAEAALQAAQTPAAKAAARAELETAQKAFQETTEMFKELGQAKELFTTGKLDKLTLKEYNKLLDKKKLVAEGKIPAAAVGPRMPATEEGFSLAVTRPTGFTPQNTPAGFNPLSKEVGGFGLNPENAAGDLSSQFTYHLLETKQIPELKGLLVKNAPIFRIFWSNLKFFVAWQALDAATYYGIQKPFLLPSIEKQQAAQLAPYYKALGVDDSQTEAPATNEDQVSLFTKIADARDTRNEYVGSLFSTPVIAAGTAFHAFKLQKSMIAQLDIQVKRKEMVEQIGKNFQLQDLENAIAARLEDIRQTRNTFSQEFQKDIPGLYDNEQQALLQTLDQYEKEMKALQSQEGSVEERTEKFKEIYSKQEEKLASQADTYAGKRGFKELTFDLYEELFEIYSNNNYSVAYKEQVLPVYQEAITSLQKIQQGKGTADAKSKKAEQVLRKFNKAFYEAELDEAERRIKESKELISTYHPYSKEYEAQLLPSYDRTLAALQQIRQGTDPLEDKYVKANQLVNDFESHVWFGNQGDVLSQERQLVAAYEYPKNYEDQVLASYDKALASLQEIKQGEGTWDEKIETAKQMLAEFKNPVHLALQMHQLLDDKYQLGNYFLQPYGVNALQEWDQLVAQYRATVDEYAKETQDMEQLYQRYYELTEEIESWFNTLQNKYQTQRAKEGNSSAPATQAPSNTEEDDYYEVYPDGTTNTSSIPY